ncbi:hypothetical protein [Phyllobacterium zundukense]|uniref:Uncharacterized protein n=1 Tax=Phyllobacterium zundukense TaxID=1867719 RepID=A0ACD4CXD2_9HYPH|nr:hypothetical protein [Phyllobacterium zundukense]UXN58113.1 hypothetical protein N8E88_04615 [Phyllobacterium zundukense]
MKNSTYILGAALCAVTVSLAMADSGAHPSPKFGGTSANTNLLLTAQAYLNTLPVEQKLYVFPSNTRLYEASENPSLIGESLSRYNKIYSEMYDFENPIRFPQITIILNGTFLAMNSEQRSSYLSKLSEQKRYKEIIRNLRSNANGCIAQKFQSRNMWASNGFIVMDTKRINKSDSGAIDRCLHAGLDYINGFPIKSEPFDYETLPEAAVRIPIMKAIHECAYLGLSDAFDNNIERSRGNVTARPSLLCVKDNISSNIK